MQAEGDQGDESRNHVAEGQKLLSRDGAEDKAGSQFTACLKKEDWDSV